MLELQVTSQIDIDVTKIVNMRDNDRFWKAAAIEWHMLYSPYVPRRIGYLMDAVEYAPKTITHIQPYAHYLYEGEVYGPNLVIKKQGNIVGYYSPPHKDPTGRPLNYSTDLNPLASAEWDKAAFPTQYDTLIRRMQAFIDGGGGILGG